MSNDTYSQLAVSINEDVAAASLISLNGDKWKIMTNKT